MNRTQKAKQIFSETKHIHPITKNQFSVDSQTNTTKSYHVRKIPKTDIWVCECPDFHYRLRTQDDKHCKHIKSCILLQERTDNEDKIEKIEQPQICPKCDSTTIKKNGFRKLKNDIKRQKYQCKQCNRKFILGENGFSKISSDPKIIAESINLVMSGVSYRNIKRHIYSTHNVKISHVSVNNWIRKYTRIIKEYVESFYPELGDVWSLDEMVLNVKNTKKTGKGFQDWLWSIIDPKTKFLIATEVSKQRRIEDARKIISSGKKLINQKPSYILTDSLHSYKEAIRKEFLDKVAHVKTKSIKDGFVNRPIERYHNEIRERLKARRGLGNDESAQTFSELLKINHNFVKLHQGLDGKTPAEAANIDLGSNKYLDLIKQAGIKPNFVTNLGKRLKKLEIINDGDSMRITTKTWIDKTVWREINDILKLYGFNWLSQGKDSCWLKMNS